MTLLRAMVLLGISLTGCASTSGRDWLNSPIEERAQPSGADVAEGGVDVGGRPRLNHTVTLGESYAVPSVRGTAAPASGVPVQVNVQTQVPVVVNNYGGGYGYGYGLGYGVASPAPVRATRSNVSSPPQVGADFPAVPDFGPPAMR